MKRITLYITIKQFEILKQFAKDGIKVSEHIRRAIDEYINKLRKEKK